MLSQGEKWSKNMEIARKRGPLYLKDREHISYAKKRSDRELILPKEVYDRIGAVFDSLRKGLGSEYDTIDLELLLDYLRRDEIMRKYWRTPALVNHRTNQEMTIEHVVAELSHTLKKYKSNAVVESPSRDNSPVKPLRISKGGLLSYFTSNPKLDISDQVSLQLIQQRIEIIFNRLQDHKERVVTDLFFSEIFNDVVISERMNVQIIPDNLVGRYLRLNCKENLLLVREKAPRTLSLEEFSSLFKKVQINPDFKKLKPINVPFDDEDDYEKISFGGSGKSEKTNFKIKETGGLFPNPPPNSPARYNESPVGVNLSTRNLVQNLLSNPQELINSFINEDRKRMSLNISKRIASSSKDIFLKKKRDEELKQELEQIEKTGLLEMMNQLSHRSASKSTDRMNPIKSDRLHSNRSKGN